MAKLYKTILLVSGIFLLALLMQFLREGSLYLPQLLLALGFYLSGLLVAMLLRPLEAD